MKFIIGIFSSLIGKHLLIQLQMAGRNKRCYSFSLINQLIRLAIMQDKQKNKHTSIKCIL